MRTVSLRRRLLVLAAAGILPLAAISGIALWALAQQQQVQAERAALELARALGTAVDAELRRSTSVLDALAASLRLDNGDLKGYYQESQRVVASRPFWLALNLAEPSGKVLLNTLFPFGSTLPSIVERESFDKTVKTLRPAIGNLSRGGPGRDIGFTVRVPVMRDGKLRYVLTVVVKPDAILDIVNRQRVSDGWVISVFDAKGMRVARSRAHQEYLGTPASPSLARLMEKGGAEGSGATLALEGDPIIAAYVRLEGSGWTVAPGMSIAFVNQGVARSVAVYGGGILLSILLGGLAALVVARGIRRPIARLSEAAQALGRGEKPTPPATNIREIREAAQALLAADAERSHGEAEREELLRREQAARAAAEQASRAKDEFLAMLGHELRNPLGAVANAVRLLDHPRTNEETALRARRIIARQVDHLARMTDDLLDAGRTITGKITLQRQPLDLAAAVADTLATLKPRIERHRLVVQTEPSWVDADPTRLEQIVGNLIVNAVKYTPEGGTIRIGVRDESGAAVLRVADEGIGMPPELVATAFDLFVQGERGLDRSYGGLGIGLTLVRRLAELHGGSVTAKSAGPGLGSEFIVRLPLICVPAPVRQLATTERPVPARDILIVEDNTDARETLRKLLEFAGHRVRTASDGAAGVEAALAALPEVALVDIGLPKLDGYEVAKRIRAAADGSRRPLLLVALTGYGLEEDRERAFAAGFDAHLVKPVAEDELERLLATR
jgi:signal transduction histidine kinase